MTAATTWDLDREHEEFRASVRAFVDRHVRPVVEESEQAGRPPAALLKEMGSAGLLGLAIGEEDGGGGGDALAMMVLSEELARASGGITTRATPHSGGYRLDGTKMFITNAGIADVFVVAARTAPDGHRGITTFIVEAGTPGLSLGQPLRKMGWHASDTREVILADCLVPPEAVLGEPNRGFHQIMSAFQLERLTLAAMGVGHAEECLALATAYARDRQVFGSPLISLQATRHRLAALSVELEAARVLTYRAAARLDSGHPETGRSVAMAKYHAAIAANRIIDECVQLFGGAGFLEETAVARHYRDARVLRIGGGTDEIQLEILAKDLPA